jgi:hypothetical protein
MGSWRTSVEAELELRLVVPGTASLPVPAGLRYVPSDPYAVHITFQTGVAAVEWTFARQLLTDGVSTPTGEGDVSVWPSRTSGRPVVCLSLSSPSGRALFEVPLDRLVEFLTNTYAAVPTGCESDHIDLDGEIAALLSTGLDQ